jgi:hypothetical protein
VGLVCWRDKFIEKRRYFLGCHLLVGSKHRSVLVLMVAMLSGQAWY